MATRLPAAQKTAAITAMFPHATTVYFAWSTTTPGITGAHNIVGFTRQGSAWSTPATGKEHNASALTYVTAPSCTIKYFTIWSAATTGTYKGGGATTATLTVPAGSKVTVAIGAITIAVTG